MTNTHSMEEDAAIGLLCTVDLPEEDYPIVRNGQTVVLQIRGLSHDEGLKLQEYSKKPDTTNDLYEQRMLSQAIVWPKMKAGQIKAWQKSSRAGEINDLVEVVLRLSGLDKEAPKNAYKSVSGESES